MAKLWLHGALLIDPEQAEPQPGALLVEGERIAARFDATANPPLDARPIDLSGARLAPGFLDIHYHGELPSCGVDDAHRALLRGSASLARHGVTAFLATSVAWPAPELRARVERIAESLARSGWPGATPIGVHLEGPWIRSDAAGAQPPGGIRAYDANEGAELFDRLGSWLRLVTLAPELPGARALETALVRRGIRIALGHTLADRAAARQSVENGASHVTHLFNAMGSHSHRAARARGAMPEGFAEVALAEDRLGVDLIADGAHVHPEWLRMAAVEKRHRALLISDRIDVPADGAGWLGSARMQSDGVAWRLPDGRLAGSLLTLDRAIRNAVEMRVMSLHAAIAACTLGPARLLGIEREHGTLRVGARADLVALDAGSRPIATWIGGRRVWRAESATSVSG